MDNISSMSVIKQNFDNYLKKMDKIILNYKNPNFKLKNIHYYIRRIILTTFIISLMNLY